MAAIKKNAESSAPFCRLIKETYSSGELQIYKNDREVLASRSSKVAAMVRDNPHQDLSRALRDIPAHPEIFELLLRFCHGYDITFSSHNILPLSCLAHHLGMTESHSIDNLLKKALTFFGDNILPSWNESIKALRTSENVIKQAMDLGLVDACFESIIGKALADPHLLGEPFRPPPPDDDDDCEDDRRYRPNPRRRLFSFDWQSEDLSTLPLGIYMLIIDAMTKRKVPSQYVAASLCRYLKNWVFSGNGGCEETSIYKRNGQREAIEAVERLLPPGRGLVPCTLLFEMLRFAASLEASSDCRDGIESRIGTQLDQATVKDLLIPSRYDMDDVEWLRRILKNFYGHNTLEMEGVMKVAQLMEDLLVEVASDIDLKMKTFVSLMEMAVAVSKGTQRISDGIYRGIDVYLDKHKYLTEKEREEVCEMLDYQNLSPEAFEHAARNERLPLRVVVQVLFVGQMQLRDTITRKAEEEEEEEEEEDEDNDNGEMEKMGSRVMELEKECHVMRKEIENGRKAKKRRVGMWKAMKRKFGCISSSSNNIIMAGNPIYQSNKKMAYPR